MLGPVAVLAIGTLAIGLFAEPFLDISLRAADELMDPSRYIETVLGGDG
jgi:multicomponent Na+:H+ antiporter subunit D